VLSNIKRLVPADQREAREQADRAYDKLLTIGEGIRHLSHELHPAVIEHSGLVSALASYCTEFESVTKVSATVQAKGQFDDLPANAQLGIYRIAQEALHNIWKHAGVREAGMCLARAGERVQLQVSDRGVGFDPAQLSKEAGLGLISMRERARLLGGSFSVESSPGKGTSIIANIPVKSAHYADVSEFQTRTLR
jgi:signal transduction histidine kinase